MTMKLVIKMLTKREEGYQACCYASTPEEAKRKIKFLKFYYQPVDIYFMIKE